MINMFKDEIETLLGKKLRSDESDLLKHDASAEEIFVLLVELSRKYNIKLSAFINTTLTIDNIYDICCNNVKE